METEAELIRKYEHVLATVREQIRGLKTRINGRRSERRRESPIRGNGTQDIAKVEFQEELVRKEFELEECLLELDELKGELRRQTLPKDSPFPVSSTPPPLDDPDPQFATNPGLNWEDIPVREDLTRGSHDDPEFAPEGNQFMGDVDLLRQKVDVIERENRLLREKADIYDSEIHTLQTRLQKSLQRSGYRSGRLPEESRPSIKNLRKEVKDELNREIATPRSSRIQKKIESLHESVMVGGEDGGARRRAEDLPLSNSSPKRQEVSALATLLLKKENAIQDMTTRLDTLTEEYQSLIDSKAAKEMEKEKELQRLKKDLEEKDKALEDVKKQYEELAERYQEMAGGMTDRRPGSQPTDPTSPRLNTDPDAPVKFITDVSEGPTPDPKPARPTAASSLKPLVNTVKEAVGRQTAAPTQAKAGMAGKLVSALKGKAGTTKK